MADYLEGKRTRGKLNPSADRVSSQKIIELPAEEASSNNSEQEPTYSSILAQCKVYFEELESSEDSEQKLHSLISPHVSIDIIPKPLT